MNVWIIDKEYAEKAKSSISGDPQMMKKWISFEKDVTSNPFYHPKHKRIMKVKTPAFSPGTYRYKKDPLRVVYFPQKEKKVIYPLEAGTATDISYKKRSKR